MVTYTQIYEPTNLYHSTVNYLYLPYRIGNEIFVDKSKFTIITIAPIFKNETNITIISEKYYLSYILCVLCNKDNLLKANFDNIFSIASIIGSP